MNFNTVLTREKRKKEQIISELNEKLKNLSEQQEKDKSKISSYCNFVWIKLHHNISSVTSWIWSDCSSSLGLIESLTEDRAAILQEKKHLEEELNRLRSTALVASAYFVSNPLTVPVETPGACGPAPVEMPAVPALDTERLMSVATLRASDDRIDSAVEASLMTVQ